MLLVNNSQGIDVSELLEKYGCTALVSVTSTNLTITFKSAGFVVSGKPIRGMARRSAEYAENNEDLVLTPDEETRLVQRDASIVFEPVAYKNQKKGFRIRDIVYPHFHGQEGVTNVAYIALSDTPIEVNEDDVEMILETKRNRAGYPTGEVEWKKFEREGSAQVSPSLEAVQPVAQAKPPEPPTATPPAPVETPDPVVEDETSEGEAQTPSRLWYYVAILSVLCAGTALWFIRKKR